MSAPQSSDVLMKPDLQFVFLIARTVFDQKTTYVQMQQRGFFIVEQSLASNSDMPPLLTRWAQLRGDPKYEIRTEFPARGEGHTRLFSPDGADFDEWLQQIHAQQTLYSPHYPQPNYLATLWDVHGGADCKQVKLGPLYDQGPSSIIVHQPLMWMLSFASVKPVS